MAYPVFVVPGILVILLTAIGGMFSALYVVRVKELGTMEQINVTSLYKPLLMLSKLILFWILVIYY